MSPHGLVVSLMALSPKVLSSVPQGDMSFIKGFPKEEDKR